MEQLRALPAWSVESGEFATLETGFAVLLARAKLPELAEDHQLMPSELLAAWV